MPVLVLQLLNWDKHRDLVSRAAGHFLEREVQITEFLDFRLWPTTRLEVKGLRVASPDESFSKPLLSVSDASIEFALTPLLSGLWVVNDFQLEDVEQIRKSKQEQRGAFKEGFFLEHVID